MTRRFLLAATALVAVGGLLLAQDPPAKPAPAGVWEGPLKVGPLELRLAFHVKKADDGKLSATMDSIDQGAKGIPCGEVAAAEKKLTIDVPKLKASFAGDLSADGQTAKGDWTQSGQSFPLELKRVEKPSTLNRPQLPKKPYPYPAEDVTFENPAADNIKLAGTLTLPTGGGPFPAVVLVSGSGPQDRDETLMGHKPFLVLADHLTRKGVAVLRFDDRGTGKSGGKFEGATSADFATDAHAAVTYLKGRKEIDPKRVGLAGHSEGGVIIPMVAADHPADVAFLVLMAGTGVPGDEISRRQQKDMLKAMGVSDKDLAGVQDFLAKLLPVAVKPGPADEKAKAMKAITKEFIDGLPEEDRKKVGAIEPLVARLTDPWMLYFLAHDPRPVLGKVRCPVLAVNGELDTQVAADVNLPAIAAALKAGGNGRVTTKAFPGLNHLFQHAKTGALSEYGQIEETFAPEALTTISEWIAGVK
jgi:pimeloyl-ACP methyl ester carboxylesterase